MTDPMTPPLDLTAQLAADRALASDGHEWGGWHETGEFINQLADALTRRLDEVEQLQAQVREQQQRADRLHDECEAWRVQERAWVERALHAEAAVEEHRARADRAEAERDVLAQQLTDAQFAGHNRACSLEDAERRRWYAALEAIGVTDLEGLAPEVVAARVAQQLTAP